jgi:hypothetical protein
MVMSILNDSCFYYIYDFNGDNKHTFSNLKDAVNFYVSSDKSFFFKAQWLLNKSLDCELCTVEEVYEYESKINKLIKADTEIDQYWDSQVDRHLSSSLPDTNKKTLAAMNKPKISDVPPIALFALGAAMSDGAKKYGRFNWRDTEVTSSVFYDAILRHLTDWYNGENFADDSKVNHLGHIMASCAILLDAEEHGVLNDDRDTRKPQSISRNPTWKLK